jgi:hypothetical protein
MDAILALLKADDVKTFPSIQMPVPVKKFPDPSTTKSSHMRFSSSNPLKDSQKDKVSILFFLS